MTATFDIVVPAAGIGTRMAASLGRTESSLPKQYLDLLGVPILERTLRRLLDLKPRKVCLVVSEVDEFWRDLPSAMHCEITIGGATRADSVRAGLDKLALDDHELVLVHDSVRPLFSSDDVSELIRVAGSSESGALLATPVVDTLKYSDDGTSVTGTKDREQYWLAQTPQAFAAGLLKRALQQSDGGVITDEASAIEAMGLHPVLVPASKDNIKITTSEDLALAEFLLQKESRQ